MFQHSFTSVVNHGLMASLGTILGPTRPYLEQVFHTDSTTFSLLWAVHGFAYLLGVFVSTWSFHRYIFNTKFNMPFYACCSWLTCLAGLTSLFGGQYFSHIWPFMVMQFFTLFAIGCFGGVNISQFVCTMGPVISRPFTMLVHCFVSVGFFFGTIIVRPFLPNNQEPFSPDFLCDGFTKNSSKCCSNSTEYIIEYTHGVPAVFWPFLIICLLIFANGANYMFLACIKCSMPIFADKNIGQKKLDGKTDTVRHFKTFCCLLFACFFVSCSIERIFQSTVFKYGLCGPLALSPGDAAFSDSAFNGGFMLGRIMATFLAAFISPFSMSAFSIVTTLSAACLLYAVGHISSLGLYLGSGLVGLAISWQFGSIYSWTAMKMDITGKLAFLFSGGCGFGGVVLVPLVNFLIQFSNNVSTMILAILILSAIQVLLFGGSVMSGKTKPSQ